MRNSDSKRPDPGWPRGVPIPAEPCSEEVLSFGLFDPTAAKGTDLSPLPAGTAVLTVTRVPQTADEVIRCLAGLPDGELGKLLQALRGFLLRHAAAGPRARHAHAERRNQTIHGIVSRLGLDIRLPGCWAQVLFHLQQRDPLLSFRKKPRTASPSVAWQERHLMKPSSLCRSYLRWVRKQAGRA
jgi:hypothetical protein